MHGFGYFKSVRVIKIEDVEFVEIVVRNEHLCPEMPSGGQLFSYLFL